MGKDIFFLFVGVLMYATGYTAFILPEKVVQGAVAGISALIYYTTSFPPSISIWVLNAIMIIIAIKALTPQFVIRTVIGVTMLSLSVGFLQPFFIAHPIITPGEDKFMHVLIAALLCGTGLGIVFTHNGSTGGTDILMAVFNKYFNISFGRAMQFVDFTIISSSYFVFHSVETIIYGIVFTLVVSFMLDFVVNGSKQTVGHLNKEVNPSEMTVDTKESIKQSDYILRKFIEMLSKDNGIHRSVGYYADALCYSPKHFSKVIKQACGRTPLDLINESAIEHIKYRLKHSDKSIKEIAEEFNFPNQSFFGKYVKSYLGMSPARYRNTKEE